MRKVIITSLGQIADDGLCIGLARFHSVHTVSSWKNVLHKSGGAAGRCGGIAENQTQHDSDGKCWSMALASIISF